MKAKPSEFNVHIIDSGDNVIIRAPDFREAFETANKHHFARDISRVHNILSGFHNAGTPLFSTMCDLYGVEDSSDLGDIADAFGLALKNGFNSIRF